MFGNLIRGGVLTDKRTYIMSSVGILSAIASYLVGDSDIFAMLQAVFTICGIYFIRKSDNRTKGK
jgi:hypothetical protein